NAVLVIVSNAVVEVCASAVVAPHEVTDRVQGLLEHEVNVEVRSRGAVVRTHGGVGTTAVAVRVRGGRAVGERDGVGTRHPARLGVAVVVAVVGAGAGDGAGHRQHAVERGGHDRACQTAVSRRL